MCGKLFEGQGALNGYENLLGGMVVELDFILTLLVGSSIQVEII